MEGPRLVLTTAPDAELARGLARELVASRLAACVNVLVGATSFYRWEGEVQEEAEVLLIVKTTVSRTPALEAFFAAHHPYDVPELVAIDPAHVEAKYLSWLLQEAGGA
jgi:periplasmic divalent cation tolerance protein